MEIPNYTEMEERLLRENRDMRDKIKRQEKEILDGITHTGVWIKKLEDKSRQVCELLEKYEPDEYGRKRVLPLWADYGEGPPKRGDYNIRIRAKDGREKEIVAWHNPGNGHWLIGPKECGYVDIIQPPGETEEWRITHWQNDERTHGARKEGE